MMASDNNGTSTSLFAWDDLIDLAQTFALVGNLELLSKIIISDRSSIDDGVRWQHILDKIDQHLTMVISSDSQLTAAPRAAFWAAPPATYVIS